MREADPKCLEGLRVDLLTHNYQCAMLQLLIPPLSKVEHDHTYSQHDIHNMYMHVRNSYCVHKGGLKFVSTSHMKKT